MIDRDLRKNPIVTGSTKLFDSNQLVRVIERGASVDTVDLHGLEGVASRRTPLGLAAWNASKGMEPDRSWYNPRFVSTCPALPRLVPATFSPWASVVRSFS
jgi:hypothetical protein